MGQLRGILITVGEAARQRNDKEGLVTLSGVRPISVCMHFTSPQICGGGGGRIRTDDPVKRDNCFVRDRSPRRPKRDHVSRHQVSGSRGKTAAIHHSIHNLRILKEHGGGGEIRTHDPPLGG